MHRLSILSALASITLGSLLTGAPVALADDTICRGTLGAITVDNVIVPNGRVCTLNGTIVEGSVKVLSRATLYAYAVNVDGNIQAEGAKAVFVNPGSFVGGNIQIKQGGRARINRVDIGGDLQFEENAGALYATRNVIDGNLQAWKNTGGLTISFNVIRENLQCKENNPAPTGGQNVAGDKEDQCARL